MTTFLDEPLFKNDKGIEVEDPIVEISDGRVQGKVCYTESGKTFYNFGGIPYAEPPVGSLRFKEAVPVSKWKDIKICGKNNLRYLQSVPTHIAEDQTYGSEELLLNLYTPLLPSIHSENLPVLVFIHGGGYKMCAGGIPDIPDYLLDQGVVFVGVQSRLSIFGFLCLDIEEAPGNIGAKDQVLALKWVQKNISAFGGDSTNVTLCGLSSGCSLIEMHMLSPLTRGLFHKVIMSSSSSLHHWSFSYDPIGSAFRVGKQLGFNGDGRKELLEFFETVESETLLREIDKLKMKKLSNRGATDYSFAPVVEKEFKNVKSFLTRDPFDVIKSGDFPKLPYLSGIGNREGLMLAIIAKNRLRNAYETRDLMQYLPYEIKETDLHSIKPRIDEIYTSKFHPGDEFSEYLLHYFGDCEYASGVLLSTKFIAKYNPQVYLYYFTYSGNFNYVKNLMQVPHLDGATHCDEQGYLFSNNFTKAKCDPTDILVRDRMVQMWTSFMRTGNPTPKLTPLINEIWEPLDPERMNCLNIGEDFRMENNVLGKRRIFWEDMFLKSKKYGVERKDEIDQPRYEITKL